MKKITMFILLILSSALGFAQGLTEVTNVTIYEHHFSGCNACAPASLGDSSAYDLVTHQHVNAVFPNSYDENRDIVEHNGSPFEAAGFGFTSDSSSVWDNQFGGNGTTKYVLAQGFDYANATQTSILSAYDSASASTTVDSVQPGEVYIAKVRNWEYYVVMTITGTQSTTDNDFTFDYKYTDNPVVVEPTGIDEDDKATSLAVYPNPARSEINVQLDKAYNDISMSIANMYGSQVWMGKFSQSDLVKVNVEALPSGVYLIVTEVDGSTSQLKFVKED